MAGRVLTIRADLSPEDFAAIGEHVRWAQQEARAALLAELRERVAALPDLHHDRQEMCIDRAAVLDLLASQDAPASVTDE